MFAGREHVDGNGEKGGMSGSAKRANKATKDIKVTNSKTAELWSESFNFFFVSPTWLGEIFDTFWHTLPHMLLLLLPWRKGSVVVFILLLLLSCNRIEFKFRLGSILIEIYLMTKTDNVDLLALAWLFYVWRSIVMLLLTASLAHTKVAVAVSLENFLRSKRDDRASTMNLRVL